MNNIPEVNYYTVKADLSVLKGSSQEDCIRQDGFIYGITETRGGWLNPAGVPIFSDTTGVQLFDRHKAPFMLTENGWKVIRLNMKLSPERWGNAGVLPAMDIMDPLGKMQEMTANIEYYEGIIQLHRLFRYLAKCPEWDIANERKKRMDLKKIFVKLKNAGEISVTLFKNPEEDYWIRLFFERDIFVMRSCIIEGDRYIDEIYKEVEECRSDDFYHFMLMVYEKFPTIDLLRHLKL